MSKVNRSPIEVSEDDIAEGCNGVCLSCGEVQYGGCEPDARNYLCECCQATEVFGMEEALIMGAITLCDE